jgi:dTDP-D-glucose 4,6-dehydratase
MEPLSSQKGDRRFTHVDMDIRSREEVFDLFKSHRFDLIIHCAAQPSHDRAADIPLLDFEVNALGTLNLLEATRQYCSEAVFIHMSTNKVYGDAPSAAPVCRKCELCVKDAAFYELAGMAGECCAFPTRFLGLRNKSHYRAG